MSPEKVAAALCILASLSGAAPLVSQDPIPESEPNDSIAAADTAVLGGRVSGHSDSRGDVDTWVLVGVRAGDTIYVDVDANEFHSTMVPYLSLHTSDGQQLAFGARWDGQDPYVVAVAPKTDTYYVRIVGKATVADQAYLGHGPAAFYTINFRRASCPVISSEQEPNNSRATARTLALNSTISALSCPNGDVDLYRLDVAHPARINVEMFTPEQWSPVPGDPQRDRLAKNLAVYAPDSTLLAMRQWPMSQQDSFQLSFDADHAGPYYITASTYPGGFRFTYTLRASETLYHGPGDPIVKLKDSLSARGIAASSAGDLYVSDGYRYRILKISPAGAVSEFVNGIRAHGLAFDGLGNLYAVGGGEGVANFGLYRITPDGHASLLTHAVSIVGPAIGPDGSIWVGAPTEPGIGIADYYSVRRYDRNGRLLATYPVIGERDGGVTELAFSPSGQLYVATVGTIYRFKSGQFEVVLRGTKYIRGFAIDSAGRFYVATEGDYGAYAVEGRIDLYDADGTVLKSPFARTPVFPWSLAFGRNSDGSPNRRLFFLDNSLGEVKPGSIEISGARAPVASQRALRELMHPGSVLTAEERATLDANGNKNGRYDIGDLRMLLLRAGALP